MPQVDELAAALIPFFRGGKHFFRFPVEKAESHGAVAHDALEMPQASAAAEAFLGIKCDGDVTAFPNALNVGPAAISNAVADGPHTRELVELAASRRHSRRNGVRVIGNVHRRLNP